MDFEKAYNEALGRANKFYEANTNEGYRQIFEEIFPELKESEDERIKNFLIGKFRGIGEVWHEYSTKDIIAWLEKQGSQNLANSAKTCKVEPKFKVGDWVVNKFGHLKYITKIENDCYYTEGECGEWHGTFEYGDTHFRLWTIQDAKEGDVLCTYGCNEPKIVFILKGTPKKHYALSYHCYYNIVYPLFESDSEKGRLAPNDEDVKPATKEQRDLLFRKMKEAGYEWDAEKKELNKIEQKSLSTEETELNSLAFLTELGYTCIPPTKEKPNSWSEEDEKMINSIIKNLDEGEWFDIYQADWLKSLKERCTWKPSDEQMGTLEQWLKDKRYCGDARYCYPIFDSLYQGLKKLKG